VAPTEQVCLISLKSCPLVRLSADLMRTFASCESKLLLSSWKHKTIFFRNGALPRPAPLHPYIQLVCDHLYLGLSIQGMVPRPTEILVSRCVTILQQSRNESTVGPFEPGTLNQTKKQTKFICRKTVQRYETDDGVFPIRRNPIRRNPIRRNPFRRNPIRRN